MGWVDLIPNAGKLYIGGLHALYQKPDLFDRAGITHILSVLDFDIYEAGAFKQYRQLHIKLDDDPNSNLLQHFPESNKFIEDALSSGGGVFVHCAMGKSRSATVAVAYLMHKYGISPHRALSQVCDGRPVCSPNPGFMEQLEVYSHMLDTKSDAEYDQIYQKWLKERFTGEWWTLDRRYKESKL
jgi:dual specificity phosphatase 12